MMYQEPVNNRLQIIKRRKKMAYATIEDIKARTTDTIPAAEESVITTLLDDAAVIIDAFNPNASSDAKKVVSCRMILRTLNTDSSIPMGATQGSMSGLGYSQSWTMGTGSSGELYLSKLDKQTLGGGNRIGSYSPLEELTGGSTL